MDQRGNDGEVLTASGAEVVYTSATVITYKSAVGKKRGDGKDKTMRQSRVWGRYQEV